jgi:hypothetical protein
MPAAHEQAPPTPCTKRAESRTTTFSPNPKTRLVADIRPSPASKVGLTPARPASQPAGIEPASVPAAYEPASTPAAVFDSPSSDS